MQHVLTDPPAHAATKAGRPGRQAATHLEDISVGQVVGAEADEVEHGGELLVVLGADDAKDAVVGREAGGGVVVDVGQLGWVGERGVGGVGPQAGWGRQMRVPVLSDV